MKNIIFSGLRLSLFLFIGNTFAQQQDTLYADSPQEAANHVFALLNPQQSGGNLINRSVEAHLFTEEQMGGNYDQIHDFTSWLWMYSDVQKSISGFDAGTAIEQKIEQLGEFVQEHNFDTERQIMPFGLVLHQVNQLKNPNQLNLQNNQIIPPSNEESLYEQILIQSAASLEAFGDLEFTEGVLKYDTTFISTSSEINNLGIQIDVGNGYQVFNDQNSEIIYSRQFDSTHAMAILSYQLDTIWHLDTLQFYLTIEGTGSGTKAAKNNKKKQKYFDKVYIHDGIQVRYEVGVIYGCGNGDKLRRPVIFVPPYRPSIQPVSLKGYYKQYNVKALFHALLMKGYDIVILKDEQGNESLDMAGQELLRLIDYLNVEKKENYPNEDWENVVIGYSMGGQVSRYALMLAERRHMEDGSPHPHTKLYIPFDSPHHGVNVPIGCQTVIYEMARTWNPLALMHKLFLKDEASKDMGMHAIYNSTINASWPNYTIHPSSAPEHIDLLSDFNIDLPHDYTPSSDERKAYPSFSRNVAVSMGSYLNNYTSDPGEGLVAGQLMFKQNLITPILKPWPPFVIGVKYTRRQLFAAKYGLHEPAFKRNDVRLVGFAVPVIFNRNYYTEYAKEWDNAQGGHKNVFYKHIVPPIGATNILKSTTLGIGNKLYDNDMMFLPLVSSLGIRKTIWPNNSLYFNPRSNMLFRQSRYSATDSEFFGYPNAGRPSDHFTITPFEAVFADDQIYEHIRYSELGGKGIPDTPNLDSLRNFLLNEIEADVVQLQNKVIGE
ncbi:MAG: hypothetical protein JKY48_06545, partial [Flavobacteriales bacterium]|nr:hypothetical protein [Flavobacteriales bacterium]